LDVAFRPSLCSLEKALDGILIPVADFFSGELDDGLDEYISVFFATV
jgi:hypothetical protein